MGFTLSREYAYGWLQLCRFRVTIGWFIIGLAGLFIGFSGVPTKPSVLVALFGILSAACGIYMFNDVFDVESDLINSPHRPIPSGLVNRNQAMATSLLLMLIGIVIALSLSGMAGGLMAGIICIGILYSVPHVKLKQFFFVPNMCLGMFAGCTFLIGASLGPFFSGYVALVALLIFSYITTMAFVKEFKDVEGDAATGAKTLPVLIGVERSAKLAVGCLLLAYLFFLLAYLLVNLNILYPALMAVLLAYTVWYSYRFLASSKNTAACTSFYESSVHMSIALFVLLILGSL